MKTNKKRSYKSLLEEIDLVKRQLSEDFMFNGDEQDQMYDPEMQGQEPGPEMGRKVPGDKMMQGDSEEEVAMHAHEVIQHEPIIGKIRETAIEGLKKYADHPTSSLYEFFKKVFLESDKVLTDTGKK